jgi:hypothetical protein
MPEKTLNKWIVVTSINQPTLAVKAFGKLAKTRADFRVVVVGDTKTPGDWSCDGVDFLSIDAQMKRYSPLAELIPVRHYCRKNLGYLYAVQHGADVIIDTDDDNIPYDNFGSNISEKVEGRLLNGTDSNGGGGDAPDKGGWVNIYRHFTDFKAIWPRGLPLDAIQQEGHIPGPTLARCLVQQYLADEDPDVDAIYRLTGGPLLSFNAKAAPVILAGAGNPAHAAWVPFNSQNTLFFREAFGLLYLPCFVSFRMTDIWRSFVRATSWQSLSPRPERLMTMI